MLNELELVLGLVEEELGLEEVKPSVEDELDDAEAEELDERAAPGVLCDASVLEGICAPGATRTNMLTPRMTSTATAATAMFLLFKL